MIRHTRWRAIALVLGALVADAYAQPPSDVLDFDARENEMVASLTEHGASAVAGRIVAYFPADALPAADMQALAERLNRGLEALEAFTHSPHSWQRTPSKVEYYFHSSMFVSYANVEAGRLFISFPRLQQGLAPILHEAAHVLLFPSPEFLADHGALFSEDAVPPVWLIEGLPSYVARAVSEQTGIAEGDPLNVGSTIAELDSRCAAALSSPLSSELLPFIGVAGAPEALTSRERRIQVASAFYGCSESFSTFLVGLLGIDAMIDLMVAPDTQAQLEELTGKRVEALRADWRHAIGADP